MPIHLSQLGAHTVLPHPVIGLYMTLGADMHTNIHIPLLFMYMIGLLLLADVIH